MIKQHKKSIIISSMIILLPVLAGILLWNRLPDEMATHFDSNNVANGWSSKAFTVFGLPLFLLATHAFCIFVTAADPKRQNISGKLFVLIIWMIPIVSLFVCPAIYAYALGYSINTSFQSSILIGVIFIIVGNYLHKIKQNYTIGIKLPWTLHSEENWNRTHRFASWLWILGGIVCLISAFINAQNLLLPAMLIIVLVPMGYSYILHRKGI